MGNEDEGVVEKIGEGVKDMVKGENVVWVLVKNWGNWKKWEEGRKEMWEKGDEEKGKGEMI